MIKQFTLLVTLLLFMQGRTYSQCTPGFYTGFESGSYTPTWSLGVGLSSAQVNTVLPAVGKYKIQATGGVNAHLDGLSTTFAATSPTTITWYMYPTGAGASNYFVTGDNSISPTNCLVFCLWDGTTGGIRFVNAAQNVLFTTGANNWYKIELKNVNYTSRTFDIYINGTLFQTSFAFRSTTLSNLTRVHLYNYNSAVAAWDDIILGGMAITSFPVSTNCFGACNGSSSITISGGTAPFGVSWSSGAINTNTVSALCSGAYTVSVTYGTCTVTSAFNITQPSQLVSTSSVSSVACFGGSNGSATTTASGGVGPYTYSWIPVGTTSNTAANLTAGSYTSVVTDASNCTIASVLTVTQPSTLVAMSTQTDVTCASPSGQALFSVLGGTSPYTYSWSPNISSGTLASNLNPGTYSFTVVDNKGCTSVNTVTILSNTTSPNVNVTGNASLICVGQSATLSATGANTYSWNTSSNNASIVISPSVTTSYTVTGSGSNGCYTSVIITQTVSSCTGIAQTNLTNDAVQIYPNPSSGSLTFSLPFSTQATIYNLTGQIILHKEMSAGKSQIDISNYDNGIYFIEFVTGTNKSIHKIIKN